MNITEFADFKQPRRKPWLLLIVLVVLAVVFWKGSQTGEKPEKVSKKKAENTEAVFSDDNREESAPTPMDIEKMLARAKALERSGSLSNARNMYLQILKKTGDARVVGPVERALEKINIKLVMNPMPMPEKEEYLVARGDSLDRIARKFKTTPSLIQKGNHIANPNLIKQGDKLRILKGKFVIHVDKSSNELWLTFNDEFFKRYIVGTGKFGKTPVGTFAIRHKEKEPVWWRPDGKDVPFGDPENILGTHWMGIRATGDTPDARGYGIHGTWDNSSLGKAESAGCVRMNNSEVEELFTMVPMGTEVIIQE